MTNNLRTSPSAARHARRSASPAPVAAAAAMPKWRRAPLAPAAEKTPRCRSSPHRGGQCCVASASSKSAPARLPPRARSAWRHRLQKEIAGSMAGIFLDYRKCDQEACLLVALADLPALPTALAATLD